MISSKSVLPYLESNYPDIVKMYDIKEHIWIDADKKLKFDVCIHTPSFLSFSQSEIVLEDSRYCLTVRSSVFTLNLYKEVMYTYLCIR